MPIHNADIAEAFRDIADLLDIQGANPFRVRAYRDAARAVDSLSTRLEDMVAEGEDLTELEHIGDSTAQKIVEYIETGHLAQLDELREVLPEGLREIMRVEGLGPRRTSQLNEALGVTGLDDLEAAAREGRVAAVSGFGEKSQQNILRGIEKAREAGSRTRLVVAEQLAEPLVELLEAVNGVRSVTVAGSFRRRKETVGDLDLLVTCEEPTAVMDAFVGFEDVEQLLSRGETRATIIIGHGFHVDLRVVPPESEGAALHYFTGSKSHNIACRRLGMERGLKLNEYGIFDEDGSRIAGASEEEIYARLGMVFVPPELREGRGEIEAAQRGALPDLIERGDLRGDLHVHTDASDGRHTMRQMVEAAIALGYDYLAITDHSRSMVVAHGLNEDALRAQIEGLAELDEEFDEIALLSGCEVDILKDGGLDLADELLEELDVVICAIHSHLNLSSAEQTARLIAAIEHPRCHIIAHPTGRLLNTRSPYALDFEAVLAAAAEHGVALELNAQPTRLDLDDRHGMAAREAGVLISINSDAHATSDLDYIRHGIDQARRAWLEPADVLNTRSLSDLLAWLSR